MQFSLMGFWVLFSMHIFLSHETTRLEDSNKDITAYNSTFKIEKDALLATVDSPVRHLNQLIGATVNCEPVIDCLSDSTTIQELKSNLDISDLSFDQNCEALDPFDLNTHPYNLLPFQVKVSGYYTFELNASWENAIGAIFLKDNQCRSLVSKSELKRADIGFLIGQETPWMKIYLKANQEYFLFTSSLDSDLQTVGKDYDWKVYGAGALKGDVPAFRDLVKYDLLCSDIDSILGVKASLHFLGTLDQGQPLYKYILADHQISGGGCKADTIDRIVIKLPEDEYNDPDTCKQDIIFKKPKLEDVILPPKFVHFSCDETLALDDKGNPVPSLTGFPSIQSAYGIKAINGQYCNLFATYQDGRKEFTCESTTLIFREWTILDWCEQDTDITFTQIIEIGDETVPTFDLPAPVKPAANAIDPDTLVLSTGPFNCSSTLEIPVPVNISDNCSRIIGSKVTVTSLAGDTLGVKQPRPEQPIFFTDLETGDYLLTYEIVDACYNVAKKDVFLVVADLIAPVAICNEDVNVSIGGDGIGTVLKEEVSEGSWDNCNSDPKLKIRRAIPEECLEEYQQTVGMPVVFDELKQVYYSEWADRVFFVCCDINQEVRVELHVEDDSGNFSQCWMEVLVEDKIAPVCEAPADTTLDCLLFSAIDRDNPIALQNAFGVPVIIDNVCGSTWEEATPEFIPKECSTGTLIRKFIAKDAAGNESDTCYQEIDATKVINYELKFPQDVSSYDCSEPLTDTLLVNELGCDVIAIEIDTFVFASRESSCQEWHIRHRVINWCEFDNNPTPVAITRDEDNNGIAGDICTYVLVRPNGAFIDDNNDETDGFLKEITSTGYWEYTQVIELKDTIPPTIIPDPVEPFCIDSDSCTSRVDVFFTLFDLCDSRSLDITVVFDENKDGEDDTTLDDDQVTGRIPKFRVSGDFPEGEHCFRVEVIDGCGNERLILVPFEVVDCKSPSPVCIQELAVELMPIVPPRDVDGNGTEDRGSNVIWASDFKPVVNTPDCSPEIRYSINRKGEVPNIDSTALTLTCDDFGLLEVQIYAWDSADNPLSMQPDGTMGGPNYDYCTAFVDVQDNRFGLCDSVSNLQISGQIANYLGAPIEGVKINVSGAENSQSITADNGMYMVNNMQVGYDYTLSPEFDADPMDGVTTFDLVIMSKHILGEAELSSPYQHIAADINNSGSISSMDLIQLRKLILSLDDHFVNNKSWRFIDASFSFSNDASNWLNPAPEWININNYNPDLDQLFDFVAVKIGDVNNSNDVVANWNRSTPRNDLEPVRIQIDEAQVREGVTVNLGLESYEKDISGFQFTLSYDPAVATLHEVNYDGLLKEENVGWRFLQDGLLLISYYGDISDLSEAIDLIEFKFNNIKPHASESVLNVTSRILKAEAYTKDLMSTSILPAYRLEAINRFMITSVYPNPLGKSERLRIEYSLPASNEVILQVMDVQGRLMKEFVQGGAKGINVIELNNLAAFKAGVYFFKLQVDDKMESGSFFIN